MNKLIKNIKNYQLVIVAVLGIGIGSAIIYFSSDFNFKRDILGDTKNAVKEVIKENTVSLSNVNVIDVDTDNADVNVVSEERNDIKVKVEKIKDSKISNLDLKVAVNNDSLLIKSFINKKNINIMSFGNSQKVIITVYVPKVYEKSLDIKTSLGNIELKNFKLNNLICTLGLGSMEVNNVESKNFQYDNKDGSLAANKLDTTASKIKASLGKVTLKEFTGNLEMVMSDGSADISYAKFNNNVNIKSSLGDVDIAFPKNAEFYLNAETKLGDLQCDFPVTMQGKVKDQDKLEGFIVNGDKNKVNIINKDGDINIKTR